MHIFRGTQRTVMLCFVSTKINNTGVNNTFDKFTNIVIEHLSEQDAFKSKNLETGSICIGEDPTGPRGSNFVKPINRRRVGECC